MDLAGELRVLSLFSGCGGMDIGFEGGFICHRKSIRPQSDWIQKEIDRNWIQVRKTRFRTVFANDILGEARTAWWQYMRKQGHEASEYHLGSIVDLVKRHQAGERIFPEGIDVVTGGFPCQDFSVAGKRLGFRSDKDHKGKLREVDEASEETRGRLYYWMKQVIDITRPKIFVAENVKGLVSLGDVKEVIQKDFSQADGEGYIVVDPQVLHAGDYGVPESRERVIFIGIRKSVLRVKALEALSQTSIPEAYNPYPSPTHACTLTDGNLLPPVVCRDVFVDLREPEVSDDPSQRYYSRAKYMGTHCQGQKEIDLDRIAPTIRSEHHGNIEYRRLSLEHGGRIIKELDVGLRERRLTPRECAMIQTFPPDYPFVSYKQDSTCFDVSPSGAYKVIGNAVPPVLAYHIANRIQALWPLYFEGSIL